MSEEQDMKKGLLRLRAHALSTFLSRLSHQASSAAILCSHPRSHPQAISHLAVVSGGGQLLVNYWTSICCDHGLVVGYFSTIEHQLLVVNFLWSSMNEFLERSLSLLFRERRVSALNPKEWCRLVGWKHESLPVLASFWPTTANPPLNQSVCF